MHDFYSRVRDLFEQAGSNRRRFCLKHRLKYQTLQSYWNTDRLPPGGVLEKLAQDFHVSLDYLVLGRNPPGVPVDNPILGRLLRYLLQQDGEELLRVEGALRMYRALSAPLSSRSTADPEQLTELLTRLARQIQDSGMSSGQKESAVGMLKRIVLNAFGRELEVADDWAELEEEVEP